MNSAVFTSTIVQGVVILAAALLIIRALRRDWSRAGLHLLAAAAFAFTGSVFASLLATTPPSGVEYAAGVIVHASFALVPVFGYLFSRELAHRSPLLDWLVITVGAILVLGALLAPAPVEVNAVDSPAITYQIALGVEYLVLLGLVTVRLWRGSREITQRIAVLRMRTMAGGAAVIAVSAIALGAVPGAVGVVVSNCAAAIGAFIIAASFVAPNPMRNIWRRADWERFDPVLTRLDEPDSADGIAASLMPYIAHLCGAAKITLRSAAGNVRAQLVVEEDKLIRRPVRVRLADGVMEVYPTLRAPGFGGAEVRITRLIGVLAELSIDRLESISDQRRNTDALRRSERTRSTVLAAIGHDLRTPLTVVMGFAQTIEQHPEISGNERLQYIGEIVAGAQRIESTLDDLLALLQSTRGQGNGMVSVDLFELVQQTALAVSVRSSTVSTAGEHLRIAVDPPKIKRVVEHLVVNADKHTQQHANVVVRVARAPDGANIIVDDDGPGIPGPVRSQIFQPIDEVVPGLERSAGSGLGLTLVADFVRMHHGRVWIDDSPLGGCRVVVWLPRQPQMAAS